MSVMDFLTSLTVAVLAGVIAISSAKWLSTVTIISLYNKDDNDNSPQNPDPGSVL